jgi:iron complex outermembrane receptor protein
MKLQYGAALMLLVVQSTAVLADDNEDAIDEIIVAGHSITTKSVEILVDKEMIVDTATALKNLPGADVNNNGTITGIAQYRGMYGDRVAVTIDNHAVVSGGPNSMDAPLSYVPPMITESIVIERGIASVSSAPETIGGHLTTTLARGDFGGDDMSLAGFIGTRYSTNGNLSTSAGRLTLANASHRVSLLSELDNGNDISTPSGEIRPSAVDRQRYDVSYAYANGESHFVAFAGKLETRDSGTPALPMDIRLIDTDLAGSHFLYAVSSKLAIEGRAAVNDVFHLMDNFSQRSVSSSMSQRLNTASGKGQSYALAGNIEFDDSSLRLGFDGLLADHDSTITNPTNAMFEIVNFNAVERNLASLFVEWNREFESSDIEIGVSAKRVDTSAGNVSFAGMMSPAAAILADAFNATDRDLRFDDFDAVAKYRYRATDSVEWLAEIARKSRAPSYQELYLWLPMQSTGGLADGRSYVGDLDLESEVSNEMNVGVFVSGERFSISPQIFYKQVDGYIQGTPSSNAAANMVSMMMTGQPALQFSNTDAEIWGVDLAWDYQLTDQVTLDGVATFASGKRVDVPDNLYRLAPPNGSVGLTYTGESWSFGTRVIAYARQDKVSMFNAEQSTSAYEIVDARVDWTPTESIRLEAHVQNLFNANYQDHLTGINRAAGSDIPVGIRLPGAEQSIGVGLFFSF